MQVCRDSACRHTGVQVLGSINRWLGGGDLLLFPRNRLLQMAVDKPVSRKPTTIHSGEINIWFNFCVNVILTGGQRGRWADGGMQKGVHAVKEADRCVRIIHFR